MGELFSWYKSQNHLSQMISFWRDFRLTYTARGKASADVRGSMTTFLWHLFLCGAMLGSKAVISHFI